MANKQIKDYTQESTLVGTEKFEIQKADNTTKFTTTDDIAFYAGKGSTVLKSSSYAITDTDAVFRVEVDTTSGDITKTLPLKANNLGRRIEIANIKGGTNKVIINPHATDSSKLSNDGLAAMWLPKIGDFVVFQESANSGYWEIVNERITSQLRLNTYAGYGSTDTKIVRFKNSVENCGNMFSENHSTGYASNVNGLDITINRSGRYAIEFTHATTAGGASCGGLSLNSSQLTTTIVSITISDILHKSLVYQEHFITVSLSLYFKKGDIIRPHTDAAIPNSAANEFFSCTYLGQ